MFQKKLLLFASLIILVLVLWLANLVYGHVMIPFGEVFQILQGKETSVSSWSIIVLDSRVPQAITALLAGASLAISGLLLQTLFKNPLAGPSIMGISEGANLGVAFLMLFWGSSFSLLPGWHVTGSLAVITAAFIGSSCILGIILYFSTKLKNPVMLLIVGIMVGYIASSVISILNFYASADRVHTYVMWGLGNFSDVTKDRLPYFVGSALCGLTLAITLIKPLNALLLGELYAANLGIRIRQTRFLILFCTSLLTASVTAFCGPIAFIGLAVPHIARLLIGSSNHKTLVPATLLLGSITALFCNMLTVIPFTDQMIPLNAVTPIIGAPVIIYVIVNRRNIQYFN